MTTTPTPSMTSPEVIAVDSHVSEVQCNGGGGALGHPVVYYAFDGEPSVSCQYCGRVFVKNQR
ncbi:MAG TPA: zinc-finger domain-containing protein [Alphaproteobacteria bacterium]|nr:zinc-finger domain-containing protein [Alphaproteobacteria bacterium]HNS44700.1 zinc-finger domain-containing protein [Alphaproteobacteria bacterium]